MSMKYYHANWWNSSFKVFFCVYRVSVIRILYFFLQLTVICDRALFIWRKPVPRRTITLPAESTLETFLRKNVPLCPSQKRSRTLWLSHVLWPSWSRASQSDYTTKRWLGLEGDSTITKRFATFWKEMYEKLARPRKLGWASIPSTLDNFFPYKRA